MYQQAQEYYNEHGNLLITPKINKKLYQWLKTQRKLYMEDGKLTEQQKELLSIIEIDQEVKKDIDAKTKVKIKESSSRNDIWESMYEQAKEYFGQHGDLLVPRTDEYSQLYTWVKAQRRKYKSEDGLSQEEIESLETIGMVWDAKQHQWDTMYAQAKAYYEEHGNLSFPYNDKRYKKLSTWIQNKKSGYYGKGSCRLTEDQLEQLQAIGAIPYDTDEHEESLEELEDKLQSLAKKKKQTNQLVEDYQNLQRKTSQDKGVEK